MSHDRLLRHWAAAERQSLTNVALQFDVALAHRAARRFVYENTAYVKEVHGPKAAVDMLYAAADAIVLDGIIDDAGLPDLPGAAPSDYAVLAESLEGLPEAIEHMADAVSLVAEPRALADRAWWVLRRLSWWPLAFVAGLVAATAFQGIN